MVCNNCQKEVAGDGKFCPYCGGELREVAPVCANCGASLEENSKFCPRCGITLRESNITYQQIRNPLLSTQESEYTGKKTVGAYWASVISSIISFIIRVSTQEMHYSWDNFLDNRKVLGIDGDLKPVYTIIPVVATVILSLLIVSDQETSTRKKWSAFIINAVLIALSVLFIWFDIPYQLLDF